MRVACRGDVMSFFTRTFERIASLSPLQQAQRLAQNVCDEAALERICIAAQDSPTAQRALRWAALNDLKISFADLPDRVLGTYSYITGAIALSSSCRDGMTNKGLATLVHEIRHAWQDQRGLLPHTDGSHYRLGRLEYLQAQLALCEADAGAFGEVTESELRIGRDKAFALADSADRLEAFQHYFKLWFHESSGLYGRVLRDHHAQSLAATASDAGLPTMTGINPYDHAQRINLGRDFSGNRNYIAGMDQDYFVKFALAPQQLLRDHDTRFAVTPKGSDIRKAQMTNRLHIKGRLP